MSEVAKPSGARGLALRPALKFVAGQALAAFIVLNIVVWTICLGFSVYRFFEAYGPKLPGFSKSERMAGLPNYAGVTWARTHFEEFHFLPARYVSYIGWRREPYRGKTINLVGPYAQRISIGEADAGKPSVYFFGGSTMWGTGADDANTIPSLVMQLGGFRSQNYGETGWTAHQSLVLLMQLLQEGHRPDIVVFYDGVNEVMHKCRRELSAKSHGREHQIRSALQVAKPERMYGLQYMLGPLKALAGEAQKLLPRRNQADCDSDPAKAQQVAEGLIQDWDMARKLVEAHGGRFFGILQPVAYYSRTKLDHLRLPGLQGKQYQAVYPLIKEKMAERPGLHDLTAVLDKQEHLYIDFSHLSPGGNRYVAEKLVQLLTN